MTLSFGGALMPIRVEDYENIVSKQNTAIGSIISLRKQLSWGHKEEETIDEKLQRLGDKVRERIDQHSSVRLPKQPLLLGMGIVITLYILAQVAMAVVEQGGVSIGGAPADGGCICGTLLVGRYNTPRVWTEGLTFRSYVHNLHRRQGPTSIH